MECIILSRNFVMQWLALFIQLVCFINSHFTVLKSPLLNDVVHFGVCMMICVGTKEKTSLCFLRYDSCAFFNGIENVFSWLTIPFLDMSG